MRMGKSEFEVSGKGSFTFHSNGAGLKWFLWVVITVLTLTGAHTVVIMLSK